MQLNRRHKAGLFLTVVIVGVALLLDVSAKESVGISLLGLAATWLVGNMSRKKREARQVDTRQKPETLAQEKATEQPFTPVSEQHTELSGTAFHTTHKGAWIWFIVSTVAFVALLGLDTFNMTWQLIVGEDEKAGEDLGRMLILLIILGLSARQTWKSLLSKEPETETLYKRRHLRFNLIAATCSIVFLFSAIAIGVVTGNRIEKNKRLDATISQIAQLGPKNAELREQIKAILAEETPTFQDYYLRCIRLESVLNEYDLQRQRLDPLMKVLSSEAADQPKSAEIVSTLQRINDKDAEVMKLFRLEIAESKELITLPSAQQRSFYLQQIVPVDQKAIKGANEEIQMMRDAEKSGVVLPSDLQQLLKPKQ
jgi:hypothetical protein